MCFSRSARYQQEGINWLAFLKRFNLHGALCDDMGLGKTLQASAILASDTVERADKFRSSGSPEFEPLPSLVVCPPTLVAHWAFEVEKFIPPGILRPFQYAGTPSERQRLLPHIKGQGQGESRQYNLIVTSYEALRSDIGALSKIPWNYCVLDEGHLIKGAKTRLAAAVKQINARHRLILTGTPIQVRAWCARDVQWCACGAFLGMFQGGPGVYQ